MAITLAKKGSYLIVTQTGKATQSHNLDDVSYSNDGSVLTVYVNGKSEHSLPYADITSPTSSDIDDLQEIIGTEGLTATVTSVSVGTGVATLAAANKSRKRLIVYLEGTLDTYNIKYGSGASTSDFTVEANDGDTVVIEDYKGIVTAVCTSSQAVNVTEILI